MVLHNIVLEETVTIADITSVTPSLPEMIRLYDTIIVIVPRIQLPSEVINALRTHVSQKIYDRMQTMSIDIQGIRTVKEGDYVLVEDIESPKKAILSSISYFREILKWENSTVSTDIDKEISGAKQEINSIPEIKAGDVIDPEHHNALVRAIKKLFHGTRKWFINKLGPEIMTNLIERKMKDIITPDDHNNKKRVLENIYNVASRVSGVIVVLCER